MRQLSRCMHAWPSMPPQPQVCRMPAHTAAICFCRDAFDF